MITAIQGTPGSGKSATAVADMAEFLFAGGVVATNFSLSPDWLDVLCNHSLRYRLGLVDRALYRRSLYDRCWKVGTHHTIMSLGRQLRGMTKRKGFQGLGRLYLDESQLIFNCRDWNKNKGFIEFFTQHRKLGWDVYLLTHTLDMIDKQIRDLVEYETRLRDLQNVKILGLVPMPWLWLQFKPSFLAITRYAGISAGAGQIFKRRLYTLNESYKDLYDTCEVFAFDATPQEVTPHGEYTEPLPNSLWHLLADRLLPHDDTGAKTVCGPVLPSRRGREVAYFERVCFNPPPASPSEGGGVA